MDYNPLSNYNYSNNYSQWVSQYLNNKLVNEWSFLWFITSYNLQKLTS